ncbi:MAG: hypothetical protein RLW68_05905 [Devosia marina]|uniref:hypothetical protein n=1 Tax=Devosia marina TaxID=2683198 RepID=UPI0032EC4CB2
MRLFTAILAGLLWSLAASGARADAVQIAFNDAIAAFEQAQPRLGTTRFGVDISAYRDALTLGQFTSSHWGSRLTVGLEKGASGSGCSRFAAYVPLPPRDGVVPLVICRQFSEEGTAALRRLTILHEMVHVVAGADECRAMAFAAEVERLATGSFTPVERYWQTNGCEGSAFSLP